MLIRGFVVYSRTQVLTYSEDSQLVSTSKLPVGFSMEYSIKSESQFCAKLLLVLNQPLRGMTHPLLSTPPVVENDPYLVVNWISGMIGSLFF